MIKFFGINISVSQPIPYFSLEYNDFLRFDRILHAFSEKRAVFMTVYENRNKRAAFSLVIRASSSNGTFLICAAASATRRT